MSSGPSGITAIEATALAKLTLSLRVLGRRDDGFHEIEALTVSVSDPSDHLRLVLTSEPGVRLDVEHDAGTGAGRRLSGAAERPPVPSDASNLVVRAAHAFSEHVGTGQVGTEHVGTGNVGLSGLSVHLHKRIPTGAGLGGGSADAAAVLVGLRMLHADRSGRELGGKPGWAGGPDVSSESQDEEALVSLAAALGSDVPFCLRGGLAWMRGRGEVLQLLDPPADFETTSLLIAVPPFPLLTPDVYRAWSELGGPRSQRLIAPPSWASILVNELTNDLEPAAEVVEPRLRGFRELVEEVVGRPAILAGSGSSYATVLPAGVDPSHVAMALREAAPEATVFIAQPARRGIVPTPSV